MKFCFIILRALLMDLKIIFISYSICTKMKDLKLEIIKTQKI